MHLLKKHEKDPTAKRDKRPWTAEHDAFVIEAIDADPDIADTAFIDQFPCKFPDRHDMATILTKLHDTKRQRVAATLPKPPPHFKHWKVSNDATITAMVQPGRLEADVVRDCQTYLQDHKFDEILGSSSRWRLKHLGLCQHGSQPEDPTQQRIHGAHKWRDCDQEAMADLCRE
ncbi:hypothetical protein CXG81DRAFT_18053 [Caulochytrium protostelioides]|uniref:Uncharacterized protein n=1 Tax=Caulochytrium protostelioides TaxID=1555241 RepID=A0A4P9XAF4_9FUNG|nr:hypothetical protein CXG81DRAFT_18053 [Caulochytrium protostelioides]|eukprot:RKP02305.1 hypothetical protein CXG81DRAFT_18053 [Caulochytrium protostelioides]